MVRVWDAALWLDVYGVSAWRDSVPCLLRANERDWRGLLAECAVTVFGVGAGDRTCRVLSGRVLLWCALRVGCGLSRGEPAAFCLWRCAAFPVQLVESGALFLLFGVCLVVPFRRRWWVYLGGVSAIRLGLDFFRGDLPTYARLSPQQLVAVVVLVALGVIGVCNACQRLSRRPRRYGNERVFARSKCTRIS